MRDIVVAKAGRGTAPRSGSAPIQAEQTSHTARRMHPSSRTFGKNESGMTTSMRLEANSSFKRVAVSAAQRLCQACKHEAHCNVGSNSSSDGRSRSH